MIRRISNKIIKKINEKRPIKLEYNYTSQTQEFSGKKALIIGGGTGIGFANDGTRIQQLGISRLFYRSFLGLFA